MIILHYINEEQFKLAINSLKKVQDEKLNDLLYKYCPIFMRHEPGFTKK